MTRRTLVLIVMWLLSAAAAVRAQVGGLDLSGSLQSATGDRSLLFRGRAIEPAIGLSWRQPGTAFGTALVDAQLIGEPGQLRAGRASAQLHDWKRGGLTWSLGAGDLTFTPGIADYGFTNLAVPPVAFFGGSVAARSDRTTLRLSAGQTTLLHDLFGNDPIRLNQTVAVGSLRQRLTNRVEVMARGSRVHTTDLAGVAFSVASSDQIGGGLRVALTPSLHVVADGSYLSYQPVQARSRQRDGSGLVGASWVFSRGWLQFNATRFSPGELPAVNVPLRDRQGLFAAGEYLVGSRVRLFSGWDSFRSNLDFRPGGDPVSGVTGTPLLLQSPLAFGARRFAGFQIRAGDRSSLSVRVEQGDRLLRPAAGGLDSTSDTGSQSAEWQTSFGSVRTFLRYARRQNVDHLTTSSAVTEHDASAQLFVSPSQKTELFGLGGVVGSEGVVEGADFQHHTHLTWQAAAGIQQQIAGGRLWLRAEETTTGHRDSLSSLLLPQQSFTVGLNGQLSPRTRVGFNAYVFHSPLAAATPRSPWVTRSTLKVVRTIPTGSEAATSLSSAIAERSKASGGIAGFVYSDWNRNGVADPDESPLPGVRIQVAGRFAATGRDGRFHFAAVPVGLQRVAVDMSTLPVDFDPPDARAVDATIAKGETLQFRFGLIPLGSIHGTVRPADSAEQDKPLPSDMVVVLDGGTRSEVVKNGQFTFNAVRSGEHTVTLLQDSLAAGLQIGDAAEARVTITKSEPTQEVRFVVTKEMRGEVRRVFPAKRGGPPQEPAPSALASTGAAVANTPSVPAPPKRTTAKRSRTGAVGAATPRPATSFFVQIAALRDEQHARQLAQDLQAAGFPSLVLESGAAGDSRLYRVRVGRYLERSSAVQAAEQLRPFGDGNTLWIVRQTAPLAPSGAPTP